MKQLGDVPPTVLAHLMELSDRADALARAADAAGCSSRQMPLVAPLAPHRYLVRFFPLGV